MKPPAPSAFRLTEPYWRGIILALSGAVILFSVWCLTHGITTIFMHLYFFPIVLLAYRYRWKGCGLVSLLALAYLGLVMVFDAGQWDVIIGAVYQFLVFVGIAAVIAYLSGQLVQARRTEQQSTEIREQYLLLAPAIVLALDQNGAITYLNRKGCEILECLPDEVAGKSWIDQFLPEKERERVQHVFSQMIAGQAEPNRVVENPVLTRGGTEKIIRWHNTVLNDEDGAVTGVLGFGEDITEEKRTQDTLRKMQQFQESVIVNANVWISVLAPDGTLLVWNEAAEVISGYQKGGVLGKRTVWKQLYPDNEYRKKVNGEIQRVIGQDDFLGNFETEIRCADGTKKTIVWNTRGLRDNGAITSFIVIGRDVTAQKSAEEQSRWSSELYREFFKTSWDCIFITSPQGQWIDFSESAPGMFGYGTREELFRMPIAALYHTPEDRLVFMELIGREGFTREYPVQLQRRDGSVIDTLITTVPIRNPDGSVRAFVGTIRDITGQKRSEDALRESEKKFRQFFNNINDALYLHALNDRGLPGKFIEVNDTMCERLGYSREELLRISPQDIVSDAGRAKIPAIAEVTAGKGHATFETEHRRKDGSIVPVEVSTVIFSLAGTRVAMASARDITERKREEEALTRSEERYRTLAEASPDQIFINDRNGTILYANTKGLKLFGLPYDQVVGKQRKDLFPPELLMEQDATFREIFDSGEPVRKEERIRFGEQELWIDTNFVPLKDTAGQVTAILGVARDITERKRAEAALRESKDLTDAVVENVPLMIFLKEARDLRFVKFNRAGEELLGYDRQALLGKNNLDLFPPEQAAHFMAKDREVLDGDTGMLDIPEEPILTAKKGVRLLHTRKVCIRGSDGTTKFLLGISEDITERKQAEEALRDSRQLLEGILNTIPVRVFWKNNNLTYLGCNTPFANDAGFEKPQDIIGKDDYSMGWRDQAELYRADDRAVIESGKSKLMIEEPQTTPTGETIYLLTSKLPLLDDKGDAIGLLGTYLDITERKRMEKQVSESRQLFADIISFLPDPTFVIDKEGKVLAWNRAIEELSGVSSGAILGKGDFEYSLWMYGKRRPVLIDLVLHPDQDFARVNYTAIQVDGRTVTGQTQTVLPTGRNAALFLVASPLFDAQGAVVGAIESIRDITRIKETEAALERLNQNLEEIIRDRTQALTESERKYHTLFDKTKDAYLIIENNKFIDCNASALQMIGFSIKEELFQIHPSLLSPPTQPDGRSSFEKAEEMMAIALRDGSNRFEWVHRRANGEDFWVEVSLTAIPIQDQQIIHTAWRDITDRKKAEAAIQASLEEKVLLLREIHHRVNNNLQIIISLINLQMRQTGDPEVKRIISATQNRVRAMSLVHEKLYRSESLSRIDFADYTRFLATQLFSFYGTDTRRVRLDMAMGKIMVDITTAVPLGLLMNELISNALRHAFPNGREGTISISGGEAGDLITLVIRDNGIGIPEEFDWKNTTSLGMRLITSLIDQVDGTIALERTNGTQFTITVKREPAPRERDA
jgi:PAS domain S-box-containing protein